MILPKHKRVVLWGLEDRTGDSFQHIWRHYRHALHWLEKPLIWLPDTSAARALIRPRDLVFAVDVAADNLGPPVTGADYLLHNILDTHPVRDGLDPERYVYLQVWTNSCAERGEAWGPVRRWDSHSRVLYQPWGTDLLPEEFHPPVFNGHSRTVVFVGSVWDGNGQGNLNQIAELRKAVAHRGLTFDHQVHIPDSHNVELVRAARLAPAIAGGWQVEHEYLPCRVFKNISYGTLGITNVPRFSEILGDSAVVDHDIAVLLGRAVNLSETEWIDLVSAQQEIVKAYTYRQSLEAIGRAFDS